MWINNKINEKIRRYNIRRRKRKWRRKRIRKNKRKYSRKNKLKRRKIIIIKDQSNFRIITNWRLGNINTNKIIN